jgi:hypothetical protein
MKVMTPYQVAVAAEAFAAGMFAQAGCDVSIQYGANQPEYDLIVTRGNRFLKVSVKGSQDGAWGVNQNYKKESVSYFAAIDNWANDHKGKTIYCFIQFQDVNISECPRAYLATIEEIAVALKSARNGNGETILWEFHKYIRGLGAHSIDEIPTEWNFSKARVDHLFEKFAIS